MLQILTKRCPCCTNDLPLHCFARNGKFRDSWCKPCRAARKRATYHAEMSPEQRAAFERVAQGLSVDGPKPYPAIMRRLLSNAAYRGRRFDVPFSIDRVWLDERLARGRCEVSNLPFSWDRTSPFMPSLDQKVAGLGYTPENTQVVVWIYNAAKQDWNHDAVLTLARALVAN